MAADASTGTPDIVPGVSQADPRPGMVELGPGYLDPALLPTGLMRHCVERAVERWGTQTLGYGANPGPAQLRAALAARTTSLGGAPCRSEQVLITAGTSTALDQIAARLAAEGRVLLTEALTYDLGRDIFEGRGVPVAAVPGPLDDLDAGELERAAVRAERASGRPPAVYLIPTFHNPTGRVLGPSRRREIVTLAERLGLLIVEDQAYAELSCAEAPPPPLRGYAADPERVISLYSFAKCLAPGVRAGWLVAGERLVAELTADPVRISGGGVNHFVMLAVAVACLEGHLDRRVGELRGELRSRRDALLAALADLPGGYRPTTPGGGYFLWVGLPAGVDDAVLVREAEVRGVSMAPGRRFGGGGHGVRLCFAARGPADLRLGAARLLAACHALRA